MKLTGLPETENRFIRYYFPALFFFFGLWYFNLRILGPAFEYIPGDLGDSRFINYLLEHGYRFLSGKDPHFWSAGFMYPYKNVIALSDNMIGTVPLYSLFRFLGADSMGSYQFWWISVFALNYWSCFLILRKWSGSSLLAVCGSFIFSFGLYNMSQAGYMQMSIRFLVPPVLYAGFRLVTAPHPKYMILFCMGIVFQFYCVVYTGFMLFYFSLIFIFFTAIFHKSLSFFKYYFGKKQLIVTLSCGIGSILLLYILMGPYFVSSRETGLRLYQEVIPNLPTFWSYWFAHDSSITWHFLSVYGKMQFREWWLQNIFPGILVYAGFFSTIFLSINSFFQKKKADPLILSLIATALLIFLIFTRTEGNHTMYRWFFKFPGINSMRVLTRFFHVQLFFLILAGLLILRKALQDTRWKSIIFIVLPVLVICDNLFDPAYLPRTSKADDLERVQNLRRKIEAMDYKSFRALAYISSRAEPVFMTQLDMMLASQQLGVLTVNGYSSSCPPDFGGFFLNENQAGLDQWLKARKIDPASVLVIR